MTNRTLTRTLRHGLLLAPMLLTAGLASAIVNDAAQGIYLTADDYQNGRLTSASDCKAIDHKIELHDLLNKPFIHVTHNGDTRQYAKGEIYGFRTCDGRDYRFVGTREYQILEAKGASIYSAQYQAGREGDDLSLNDDRRPVYAYFFSVSAAGPVLPLTRANLKRAFANNHAFHDALDQTFRSDAELAQYDDFHKMFKVNRLLSASTSTNGR